LLEPRRLWISFSVLVIAPVQTCTKILRQIREDQSNGVLKACRLAFDAHFAQAIALTERFTANHNCRTLDVLHVAAAIILEAPQFASFAVRQRKMALDLGLEIFPEQLP
jgi:hypothetical protein